MLLFIASALINTLTLLNVEDVSTPVQVSLSPLAPYFYTRYLGLRLF